MHIDGNGKINNCFSVVGDAFLSDNQALYKLDVFPDASCFRLYFPDGGFVGYEDSVLNIADEHNPFSEYEEGKLLKWMRNVVFPEQNNYHPGWQENVSSLSEPKTQNRQVIMKQFKYISDEGSVVHFEISSGGLINVRIPERYLSGSIDQIREIMPELGFLWNGSLIHAVKKEFYNVTNISLGN